MSEISDFYRILEAFQKENVDFIIIGGIAVILHGMPRASEDLDIIIKMETGNISRIRAALRKLFNDDDIKEITFEELHDYSVLRYVSPNDDMIDIISNLGEAFNYENVKYKIMEIEGNRFKVASIKSLIDMKSGTLREKDNLDLLYLNELKKKQGE